ncbi:MAG: sugar phosphate isomerase/epimerase [Bryobacterales bacterium]|nr:sugar phosphate isomerase/epimerase [Bryobacterales bacterium]
MTRRAFLLTPAAAYAAPRPAVRLSFSTYATPGLEPDRALDLIREAGYDGAELCLMPGWPTHPDKLDAAARQRIQRHPLAIPTLIENFNLLVSDADHARTLDRIRAAAALAHEIAPKRPPLLQTVLGGKPGEWDDVKDRMAARLTDWARAAHDSRLSLAIKAHIGSACDTPEKLLWLLETVRHTSLSAIYDYSHFQLAGLGLEESLEALLPHCSFLTVKDGRMADDKPRFLLPGDGTIDYKRYFEILKARRYRGWMLVEVSRQLQTQPGYDPEAAARQSIAHLAPLLKNAGLRG